MLPNRYQLLHTTQSPVTTLIDTAIEGFGFTPPNEEILSWPALNASAEIKTSDFTPYAEDTSSWLGSNISTETEASNSTPHAESPSSWLCSNTSTETEASDSTPHAGDTSSWLCSNTSTETEASDSTSHAGDTSSWLCSNTSTETETSDSTPHAGDTSSWLCSNTSTELQASDSTPHAEEASSWLDSNTSQAISFSLKSMPSSLIPSATEAPLPRVSPGLSPTIFSLDSTPSPSGSLTPEESDQDIRSSNPCRLNSKKKKNPLENRPYKCDFPGCNQDFLKNYTLNRHKKIHRNSRPFSCKSCTRRFRENDHLKRHLRVHTKEKPYTCQACKKSFADADFLFRVHLPTRHADIPIERFTRPTKRKKRAVITTSHAMPAILLTPQTEQPRGTSMRTAASQHIPPFFPKPAPSAPLPVPQGFFASFHLPLIPPSAPPSLLPLQEHSSQASHFNQEINVSRSAPADTNHSLLIPAPGKKIPTCEEAFHQAVEKGQEAAVKRLIAKKVSVNTPNSRKETPLYVAARQGNLGIAGKLIEAKAEINYLCRQTLDFNTLLPYGLTPLQAAVEQGFCSMVAFLIGYKANVVWFSPHGETLLHIAVEKGHTEIVSLLLEHNVNPASPTVTHVTPLHIAAARGCIKTLDLLLKAKAGVNAQTTTGVTPLLITAANNRQEAFQTLVANKASIHIADQQGRTPLAIAREKGFLRIEDIARQSTADNISSQLSILPAPSSPHESKEYYKAR